MRAYPLAGDRLRTTASECCEVARSQDATGAGGGRSSLIQVITRSVGFRSTASESEDRSGVEGKRGVTRPMMRVLR
jgi:hypothetical protein